MSLFRVLTENKDYQKTVALITEYFDSFTIIEATGFWKGQKEHSLVIEISPDAKMGDGEARTRIEKLAYAIKRQNKQQAVLVQRLSEQHDLL